MFRFIRTGIVICLLYLIIIVTGCSEKTDRSSTANQQYVSDKITWSDVSRKFVELEQEKAEIIGLLDKKPPLVAKRTKNLPN